MIVRDTQLKAFFSLVSSFKKKKEEKFMLEIDFHRISFVFVWCGCCLQKHSQFLNLFLCFSFFFSFCLCSAIIVQLLFFSKFINTLAWFIFILFFRSKNEKEKLVGHTRSLNQKKKGSQINNKLSNNIWIFVFFFLGRLTQMTEN